MYLDFETRREANTGKVISRAVCIEMSVNVRGKDGTVREDGEVWRKTSRLGKGRGFREQRQYRKLGWYSISKGKRRGKSIALHVTV